MVGVAYLWLRWVIMAKKMRCTIAGITVLLIKIKGFLKMKSQDFSGSHDHDHGSFRRIACNQCDCASFLASRLRGHLNTHSGEKSNKSNQCDFIFSQECNLRTHFKTHSGEKLNKCNMCD